MNIRTLFSAYQQFMQNPNQFLKQLNIPTEYSNDPQGAIQYLMNNGRITQEQYNNANNTLNQLKNNPMFKQLFSK